MFTKTDVDEGITAYCIPAKTADTILRIAGLEKKDNGKFGGIYWEKDEALRMAIIEIAENDSSDREVSF
jgi:hypothetical protein